MVEAFVHEFKKMRFRVKKKHRKKVEDFIWVENAAFVKLIKLLTSKFTEKNLFEYGSMNKVLFVFASLLFFLSSTIKKTVCKQK